MALYCGGTSKNERAWRSTAKISPLQLKLSRVVKPVAFVDDIALVIRVKYHADWRNLFRVLFSIYQEHLDPIGQQVAKHKMIDFRLNFKQHVEYAIKNGQLFCDPSQM